MSEDKKKIFVQKLKSGLYVALIRGFFMTKTILILYFPFFSHHMYDITSPLLTF